MPVKSDLQRTHGSLTNKAAVTTQYTMPQWRQLLLSKRKAVKAKTVDELVREPVEELGLKDVIAERQMPPIHKSTPGTSISTRTSTSIFSQSQKTVESQNIIVSGKLTESQNVLLSGLKPIHNPQDPNDDLKVEWTPHELIHATAALSNYNVKPLYSRKDPNEVKKVLYIVLLVEKYKLLLKELLENGRYFESFPEDLKDEPVVNIALLDLLCRGDGPSIEEQLDTSARVEYKNCGLKVIYLQVEKYKTQYYEMVHERLTQCHATSFYQLLPSQVPVTLNLQYPKKFDIWINKNKLGAKWIEDRVLLEEQSHFKPAGAVRKRAVTYREIKILPFFYELETSNFSDFMNSTNYYNNVFIPADRNHCLGMTDLIKQLIKLNAGKGSVIQTHVSSLSATAYFAYLLSVCFNPPMKLKVFGADKMKKSFDSYFDLLRLKNITVFSKRFYIENPRRKYIAKTVSVLVNPETTFNPSVNIIDEAVNRGCDVTYLQSTYEIFSQEDVHSLHFSYQQKRDLRDLARSNMQRALTIPKVKFVVYQSFDRSETTKDNNGSYVINYMTECQHDTEVSMNSDISKTDPEYINYKYTVALNSCFQQGSPVEHPFSTKVWGSEPPFIAIFYRTEPAIQGTETEEEKKKKSVSWHSDIKSSSIESSSHKTASQVFCPFEMEPTTSTIKSNKYYGEQKVNNTGQKSKTVLKSTDRPEKKKDVLSPTMVLPPKRSSHTSVRAASKFSNQSRRTLFRAQHRTNDFKQMPELEKNSSSEVKKNYSPTFNQIEYRQARQNSLRDKRNLFKKRFNEKEDLTPVGILHKNRDKGIIQNFNKTKSSDKTGNKKKEQELRQQENELSNTKLGIDNLFRAQHEHTDFNKIAHSENRAHGKRRQSFSMTSMKDLDKEIKKRSVKKKSIFSEKKLGVKKEIEFPSKQEFAELQQRLKPERNGILKRDKKYAKKTKSNQSKPINWVGFTEETAPKVESEQPYLSKIKKHFESDSDMSNSSISSKNKKQTSNNRRDVKKKLSTQELLNLKQNFNSNKRQKNEQNYSSSYDDDDKKYAKKYKKGRSKNENKTSLQTKSNVSKKVLCQLPHARADFKEDKSTSDDSSIPTDSAKNNVNKIKYNLELSLVVQNENILKTQLEPLNFKKNAELKRKENNDEENFSLSVKGIKKKKKIKKLKKKRSITGNKRDESSSDTTHEGTSGTIGKYENSQGTQTIPKNIEKGNQANRIDVFSALDGGRSYRNITQDSIVSSSSILRESGPKEEFHIMTPSRRIVKLVQNEDIPGPAEGEKVNTFRSKMKTWFQKFKPDEITGARKLPAKHWPNIDLSKVSRQVSSEETEEMLSIDQMSCIENQFNKYYPAEYRDYEIDDAEIMKARLAMFDAGERDIDKLVNPTYTDNFYERKLVPDDISDPDGENEGEKQLENETKGEASEDEGDVHKVIPSRLADYVYGRKVDLDDKSDPCSDVDKEEVKLLNEMLIKIKEKQNKHEIEDDTSDAEAFDLEEMSPKVQAKFEKLVRDILEKEMGAKIIETESSESDEEQKAQALNEQKAIEKEKEKLKKMKPPPKETGKQVSRVNIVAQRTSTRGLSKLAKELYHIRDIVEYYLHVNEERPEKIEKKKDLNKHAHGEPTQPKWEETGRVIDIVPHRTPTKGLSTLAKELYEIRDVVEYYLHSNEEPLDWRALIDRRVDD